jgi:Glycosyl transferase family 2
MSAWSGVLALTLVVRDEEDVLPANLDYHLAQGVDVVLAVDHGSSDRTPEILGEYERTGRVRAFRDEDRAHDQVTRVNRLLRIAAEEHRADWVIHCDADEFWMPLAGSLRDVFAAVPERYGYVVANRTNFVPVVRDDGAFLERMVVRERRSLNLRGDDLEPKVAQRPAAAESVAPGNHSLEEPVMDPAPDIGAVEVLHFPNRSLEQFERKVLNTGIGYELLRDRAPGIGIDQLALLDMQRQGKLRDYYLAQCADPSETEHRVDARELLVDDRLQSFVAAAPTRLEESPAVQAALRRAWLVAGAREDALAASNQKISELAAELTTAHETIGELVQTLDTIRSSRIMRMSEPARRIYYRMRPGS